LCLLYRMGYAGESVQYRNLFIRCHGIMDYSRSNLNRKPTKQSNESTFEFNWYTLIATWFCVGKIRIAPGTLGSLAVYPLYYGIAVYLAGTIPEARLYFMILIIGIGLIGFPAILLYQRRYGCIDDSAIVVDEVIGQLITIWIGLPGLIHLSYRYANLMNISEVNFVFLVAFLTFRFFDIRKVFGISLIDRYIKNTVGVMLDDVVAGIYAGLLIIATYEVASVMRVL